MLKPRLVAVDTNVLMRLADGHEATVDSWQLLKRRIRPVQFVALPTVMEELAGKLSDCSRAARLRQKFTGEAPRVRERRNADLTGNLPCSLFAAGE
jgi:rRNA-processing protein FCF1